MVKARTRKTSIQYSKKQKYKRTKTRKQIGGAPIHNAIISRRSAKRKVKELIDRGADVNQKDIDGMTPLILAILHSSSDDLLNYLLTVPGIDLDAYTYDSGQSALSLAVLTVNIRRVSALIRAGANINFVSPVTGTTPLIDSSFMGDPELTQLLLAVPGIDIHHIDHRGYNALFKGVKNNKYEFVSILIDAGANVNVSLQDGTTPLMLAAYNGSIKIVGKLLDVPEININAQNADGETALMRAVKMNRLNCVRLLFVKEGIDLNLRNNDGKTAFDLAQTTEMRSLLNILSSEKSSIKVKSGSKNAISYEPIEEGDIIVDFHDEAKYGRYYKQNTFNQFPEPKLNPMTRKRIEPTNVHYYKAHLVEEV